MEHIERSMNLFEENYSDPSDIVYTPDSVAADIVSFFPICMPCLDPCAGDGVFLKFLPQGAEYCEIRNGKDFFNYSKSVDWIVGNPPYSIFKDFLAHSFNIAENIVYIVPTNKIFQSFKVMDLIERNGGIHTMLIYGCGQNVGFPFGFSVGAFYFKKGFNGSTKIIFRRLSKSLQIEQKETA